MGQFGGDHERKSKKKRTGSSSKPSKSRSTEKNTRPPLPDMKPHAQEPLQPIRMASDGYSSPPPPYSGFSTSPLQNPIHGAVPQSRQYGSPYGAQLVPPGKPSVSHATRRVASPPPRKASDNAPFKEHWDRLDRLASKSCADLRKGAEDGVSKITSEFIEKPTHAIAMKSMQMLCQGAALYDVINSKFDSVMTSIDCDQFSGKEEDLMVDDNATPQSADASAHAPNDAYATLGVSKGSNHFSKVWLYSNSRLPPHLPPFKVFIPTWPLLCLAATYSDRVYTPPAPGSHETDTHVPADWRTGTKAMVLKSIPIDAMNTVVFAVRGTGSFFDWAVNYNTVPTPPTDFLDDPKNTCHAGFLYVARKMIKPVADRLKILLQENPARSNCSLLITGHSAGGAVAALLYSHMMSTRVSSELNYLTGFFKRVHCVTFGAPPISLYPLQKPNDKRHRKSLFYSFINEGDPIPRADKSMVKSLLKLYASPAPTSSCFASTITGISKLNLAQAPSAEPPKGKLRPHRPSLFSKPQKEGSHAGSSTASTAPAWPIPPCSLSLAGRLVVLRQGPRRKSDGRSRSSESDVEAVSVNEELMRKVVYGDPLKHQMHLYKKRIDAIATRAVTGRDV